MIDILRKIGLGRQPARPRRRPDEIYAEVLQGALAKTAHLRFAIVGANDGRINDPSFGFIRAHADQTSVLAVEPQSDLHPILRENYGFHPRFTAVQAAVGEGASLSLYKVRKDYWQAFSPQYAEGWPPYRAPTGITSSDRRHVEEWVTKWSTLDPDEVIEEFEVDCAPLASILATSGFGSKVDVLQIDAEGKDDVVAFACGIPELKPSIILFENRALPKDRASSLERYFKKNGYGMQRVGGNTLATRR